MLDCDWSSDVCSSDLVVGMISIGLAGYISSAFVKLVGIKLMPWRKIF
jgi:ABC-type nitrate/sulfonate/bicarbonate transport system permease component